MGRIIITYKSPLGFFTDCITTNHRHLEDLILDFKRMVLGLKETDKVRMADYIVYAVGSFNDDLGEIELYNKPEFIVQFPKVGE